MPCASKAIIIGGGIAGLSCSIALSKVGVECTIIERGNPALGASIGVHGQGTNAVEELGLYEKLYNAGTPFPKYNSSLENRNSAGEVLTRPPSDPYGPGTHESVYIYRPTWCRILTDEALELGVKILDNTMFTRIDNRPDGVTVTTTGGEELEADICVGADGAGSATRLAIFPDAPTQKHSGQLSVRWMAPGPRIQPEAWYNSPKGRLGIYWLPEDLIYCVAVLDQPTKARVSDAEASRRFTELLDSFTAPAVMELRRRMDPNAVFIARPFSWNLVPDPWFSARTVLIGDAVHQTTAHLGQAGGMALEDSVVLAQSIRDHGTVEEAFGAFMARRFERVRTVIESSVELSRLEREKAPTAEQAVYRARAFAAISQPY